jgi:hypothetical protein
MNIGGATVEIKAHADTSELRSAIADFDGSTDAVNRLQSATQQLKSNVGDQSRAIRALGQANRVNNFEMLEGIRVMRSVHSLAVDLNQVYQTQILRQIQASQEAIKQQETFSTLSTEIKNVINGLSVLGESNTDVVNAFQQIENEAGNLNSTNLSLIITQIDNLKKSTKLTPDELAALNQLEDHLKTIRDNTIKAEDAQNVANYIGSFAQILTVASSVGIFAANLKNLRGEISSITARLSQKVSPKTTSLATESIKPSPAFPETATTTPGTTSKGIGPAGQGTQTEADRLQARIEEIAKQKGVSTNKVNFDPKTGENLRPGTFQGKSTAPTGGSAAGSAGEAAGFLGLFLSIFGLSIIDTIKAGFGDKAAQAREDQRKAQGVAFSQVGKANQTYALDEDGNLVPIPTTSATNKTKTSAPSSVIDPNDKLVNIITTLNDTLKVQSISPKSIGNIQVIIPNATISSNVDISKLATEIINQINATKSAKAK